MKLSRDVSGSKLARRLRTHGYDTPRQAGSHLRLTSSTTGRAHHVTIPPHRSIAVGVPARIVTDVAQNLEMDREDLARRLFRKG